MKGRFGEEGGRRGRRGRDSARRTFGLEARGGASTLGAPGEVADDSVVKSKRDSRLGPL